MNERPVVLREPAQGLLCPTCRVSLVMSDRQGIEIDYCPDCRGVWLDRGELDKIIERSLGDLSAQPRTRSEPPRDPGPSRREDYYDDRDHRSDDYRSDDYRSGRHGGGHGGSHGGKHGGHGHHGGHGSFLRRLFD